MTLRERIARGRTVNAAEPMAERLETARSEPRPFPPTVQHSPFTRAALARTLPAKDVTR